MNIFLKANKYVFLICLIIWIGNFFYPLVLPSPKDVLPVITENDPIQKKIVKKPFIKNTGKLTYTISPKYSYEISGVVVSLHESDSFIDVSHTQDPLNTKDICIVWKENIIDDVFRKVKYTSGDFTCYAEWKGEDPGFYPASISNNHLIPATVSVANSIKDIQIGDQITLKGDLVDYTIVSADGVTSERKTSITRDDIGNGACEILYTTSVTILKRGGILPVNISSLALVMMAISFIIGFISIFIPPKDY